VGGIGHCTSAAACSSDAQCAAPLKRCDMTENVDQCVQCLLDADCPAPFVCSPSHTCAECTPTNQSACRIDLSGARCVAGGSCGCVMDSDCGGTSSGRVCDAATSRCVPGCRDNGGNGCPASLVCTVSGSGIDVGTCMPPPSADGGVDGSSPGTDSGLDGAAGDDGGPDAALDGSSMGGSDGAAGASGGADGGAGADGNAGSDGGAGADGNAGAGGGAGYLNTGGYVAGGGCRCSLDGASSSSSQLAAAVGLLLAAVVVRRRRRS
jgi:MYXO-CTERM domain-containing protein